MPEVRAGVLGAEGGEAIEMAEFEKRKYEYRGRVLCVWQFLSDRTYGVVSFDTQAISSYRSVRNKDLGRYKDRDAAQAALDAFAAKKGLKEAR